MREQTGFFDQVCERWDAMCRHDEKKLRYLLSRISMQSGDSVLDVGTGTGVLIPYIRELNRQGNIRAVDLSSGMIAVASRKYGNDDHLHFQIADVESDDHTRSLSSNIALFCISCILNFERRPFPVWSLVI